MPSHFEISYLR